MMSALSHGCNVTTYILKLVYTGRQYLCWKTGHALDTRHVPVQFVLWRLEGKAMDPTGLTGPSAAIFACQTSGIQNNPSKPVWSHPALKHRASVVTSFKKNNLSRDISLNIQKYTKKKPGKLSFLLKKNCIHICNSGIIFTSFFVLFCKL